MEFETSKLGDVAKIIMGQSPKSEFYSDHNGTPFLQGNRTFKHRFPQIDTYTTKITKMAEKDDILFSVRAPVGDMNIAPHDLCIGRGLCAIRALDINKDYLYYLLKSKIAELESQSTGTIFSSINKSTLENFNIKIPNTIFQNYIGSTLTNIDEKIENNNNTIANLEELSQTIFNRWFIDFEYPDEDGNPYKSSGGKFVDSELGNIPKRWSITRIDEILNITSGYAFKSEWWSNNGVNVIKIKDLNNNTININSLDKVSTTVAEKAHKFRVCGGEILIALTGATAGKMGIVPKLNRAALVNQRVGLVTSAFNNVYIYNLLKSRRINNLIIEQAIGSAQPNISPIKFGKTKILRPNDKLIHAFNEVTQNNYKKIIELYSENIHLSNLRDTLLPKLMSGEIELPENLEV